MASDFSYHSSRASVATHIIDRDRIDLGLGEDVGYASSLPARSVFSSASALRDPRRQHQISRAVHGGRPRIVVRGQPYRIRQRRAPRTIINPEVISWYNQKAFELEMEPDEMSKIAPWLFGPQGLYGGLYVSKCELPCKFKNGVCECP